MAFLDNLKNAMKTKAKEKQAQRPVQPVRPTTTADSFKNFLLSKQSRENILNTVQQRRQIEQPRQTATQNITGSQRSVSNLPTSTNKIGLTSNSSTSQYKRTTQKDIDNLKNEMRKRGASEEDINKRISELQQGKTNLPTQKALTDEDRNNFTPLVTEEDKKTGELKARTKTFYDSISEKLRNVRDVAENDVSKIVAIGGESIIPAFDNVIKGFGNLEEMWGREGTDLAMRMMSKTPFTLKDGSGEAGRFTFADTMGISKEDIEEVAKIDEAIRGVESSPIKELNKTPVEVDYKGAINRIKDKSGLTQWSEDLKQAMAENQEGIQSKGGQYIGNLTPSLVQNGLNMLLSAINPAVGTASFGASGFSSYFDEARNKGMDTRQATKYGTTMATLDSAFEQLIVFNRIDNIKGVFKGNGLLKYGLGLGKDVGENYLQEAVMEPAGQVVENLVTGQNPLTGLNDPELWQRAREEGRAGAFSSLILSFVGLGGGSIVQNESQQQAFETIDNIEQKLEDNKKLDTKDVADGIKAINSLGFDAESIINQNGEIIANALVEKSTQQQNPQTEQGFKNTLEAIRNGETVQEAVQENLSLSEASQPIQQIMAFNTEQIKRVDNTNPTSNQDIRYSLSDEELKQQGDNTKENKIDREVNQAMTPKEVEEMVERAFVTGDIKEWFDGQYKNGKEWLEGEGSSAVEEIIDNDSDLYFKYEAKIKGIMDGDFTIGDVIDAYVNGTLTGKAQNEVKRLDISKDTGYKDSSFYSPREVSGGIELYEKANQRVTNSNRNEVYKARADFIINAQQPSYIDSLGLESKETMNKIKQWANYTKTAYDLSNRLNEGTSLQNRWSGIENSSIVNTITVSDEQMKEMVKEVKGNSSDYERKYITSTMLAIDCHNDFSNLTIEFTGDVLNNKDSVLGNYNANTDVIKIRNSGQNTVAHEIGHYLDHLFGRQLFGNNNGITDPVNRNGQFYREKLTENQKQFLDNFNKWFEGVESSASLYSKYTMEPTEVFARFVARFTEWTKNVATNNRYGYESRFYNDKFTEGQYREFVKLLQEKSLLDTTEEYKNYDKTKYGGGKTSSDNLKDFFEMFDVEDSNNNNEEQPKFPTRNPKQDLGYFKKKSNENLLQEVDKEVTRQNEYEAQKQKDKEEGKTRLKLPENTISKNNFKKQVEQDKASKYKGKAERYYIRAKNNFINRVTDALDISKGSNKQILNETIDKIENTIREKGEITSSERDNLFEEMFDNVVKIDDEYYNQYKDLKKEVANEKIFVDEQAVKEIASQYDGFNNFRKKNFGNLNLSTKASSDSVSIDRVYQELQSAYGNLFPDNIYNTGEQLQYIADVVSDIKKSEMNLSSYDDEVLGGELRQYARQEFDGFVDNLISEYNRAERYKEDRRQSEIESKKKTKSSTQEIKDKYSQIPELRRQYEKASNSELLTERDRTELDRLFKGEITLDDIKPGLNRKGIEEVYKAGKKYKKLSDQLKTDRGNIKKGYVSKANDFIGDLSQWKDKKQGWRYTRETAVRNFLDIAPKDIAERINDEYIYKYAENEANRTRFINEQVNKIKGLKLNTRKKYNATFQVQERDSNGNLVDTKTTRKVSEAELVQIYGEGRISKTELQETGADVKKIENAVSTFRDTYNELLDLTNNVLIETGHAPVPKREDYFPHFEEGQDTTLQKVGKALGIDLTGKELPTSIAGQTQNFKPDKTWVGNFLERKTNITDFNVLKGFDRYINGVSDVIYHTEDIMKMRGLETAIRQFYADDKIKERINKVLENPDLTEEERYEEIRTITNQSMDKAHLSNFINWYGDYVNSLAGKKSASDRGVEKELSRKYYQAINKVQSRYSANAIGGNISVALTNTGVVFSALGETNPIYLVKSAYETAENSVKSLFGKGDNSLVSMSDFLTSRRGTESAYESTLDKVVSPINKLVNSFDNLSTEIIVRAKYEQNLHDGMSEYEALENADNYARGLIADRSKGMLPTQFNKTNPVAKLMNAFQVEANNQLSYIAKDLNRNVSDRSQAKGWSKAKAVEKMTMAYTGLFLGNFLVNEILGRVRGNQTRLLIDPIYMLKELIKGLSDDDEDNDYATLKKTGEEIIGQLPFAQVPIALFGESIGLDSSKIGRVPIAGAVPNISKTVKSWTYTDKNGNKHMSDPRYILQEHWKEYQKPLLNLALPYGGMQLKKTANAIDTMVKGEKTKVDQEGKESIKYVVQDKGIINSTKALLFGDTARSEYQEYAEGGYKGLTSKQTELYREMKIPYKEFLDYTKMNFESDKDKNGKAISGSSKAKRLEWILNSKMSDKNKDLMIQSAFSTDKSKDSLKNYKYVNKDYSTLLYYSNLSADDKAEYNKMAKAGINQKQYIAYKNKIKALTKAGKLTASKDDNVNKQKKIEELMKSNLSAKDKALIYELDIGSKDNYYKYYKASGMNINEYLKYQTQDFESDKIDDGTLKGKTISGSLKAKKVSYVNNMNITYEQKLLLLGSQYSLSKQERSIVANYINGLKMSAQDKLDLYAKMKGFTVYKDGRVSF